MGAGAAGERFFLMIVPLLVCNTYQILVLHRLSASKQAEEEEQKGRSGHKAANA